MKWESDVGCGVETNTPPQHHNRINLSRWNANLTLSSAFVNTSATWSWEVIFCKITSPLSTLSRTKCWCTAMCFIVLWCIGFLDIPIHPVLSSWMIVGPFCEYPNSLMRRRSQTASLAAWLAAMYSASVDEVATHPCCLELQLIGAPFNMNVYPDVDFRDVRSPA